MGGISFSIDNLIVPPQKDALIAKAEKEVKKIEQMYMDGIITNGERYNKILSIWTHTTAEVADGTV
jgi:DNA-directed RNA polymerase subunit beta'